MEKYYRIISTSLKDFGVSNHQELWEKVKALGYKGFEIDCISEIKTVDEANSTIEAVFSTADEDRHGDIVLQNWDLKYFKKNPVIINSHNYYDATEVIGKAVSIKVIDGKLQGKIKFAVEENPKAKIIYDLYKGGFLNAFSVGFIAKEFDDKGTILKSELLEVSAVSVPANAMAMAKAKGIEVNKLFDDGKGGKKDIKNKEFKDWSDGDVEARLKIRDIAEFEDGAFEKIIFKTDIPIVRAIVGVLKSNDGKKAVQSLFFPKADGWALDDAKKWFEARKKELLEPITQKEGSNGFVIVEKNKTLSAIAKVANDKIEKRKSALQKIIQAIKVTSEVTADAQGAPAEKLAETNRLINQAVRKLVKLKE